MDYPLHSRIHLNRLSQETGPPLYIVEFKLAERALYEKFRGDIQALRRRSEVLGPAQQRKYTIDISHHEFCEGKVQREVDDYVVYVYSLEMIAAEKLRDLLPLNAPEFG